MNSYRSKKVEKRPSKIIGGYGIFAREAILQGEIVCIKGGHILSERDFENLGAREKQYCLQISDHFFIGPRTQEELPRNAIYINHSCEPNVGFEGDITYVALREISAGEELTHDYAMCFSTELTGLLPMACSCHTELCRGTITGNDWKHPALRERYGNHFSAYILKKLSRMGV